MKKEQERIFQPFGKIERDGPGLSLCICKKIIELN